VKGSPTIAHTHLCPLFALTVAAALAVVGGVALPGQARSASAPYIPRVASCPAGTVCDVSLGVALPLPAGWMQDMYPAGILEFSARLTAGATSRVVRLNIASWGTTSDHDDARVAAAGMDALLRSTNSARPFARVPVHFLGASGVLVSGLPSGTGPVTALILARAGVAYKVLAPGVTLAPDQRQALDSLRFILRSGSFPPANGVGVPATTPLPAACGLAFPSSHSLRVISVSSGAGTLQTLASGPYRFILSRYRDFNAYVRQATGITPPPGDIVLPFTFGIPGGHYYVGLTNVVRQGAQDRVCLRGAAYRDLGNGSNADRTPPVAVTLVGTLGATYGRVDLYVGAVHYFVFGHPHTP